MPSGPDNGPANRRQKSPGRKLVEKFTIPERPRTADSPAQVATEVAHSGAIRRHISPNRRKASLAPDEGLPVPTSRKSSVSEELLKEEEAIFDSLIREEIARTNGIPERRNSFDCVPVDPKRGRHKSKRFSVDFEAAKGLESSESLSNFIEKLNADISRTNSTHLSPVETKSSIVFPETIVEDTESILADKLKDSQDILQGRAHPGKGSEKSSIGVPPPHPGLSSEGPAQPGLATVLAHEDRHVPNGGQVKGAKLPKQRSGDVLGEQLDVNSKSQEVGDHKSGIVGAKWTNRCQNAAAAPSKIDGQIGESSGDTCGPERTKSAAILNEVPSGKGPAEDKAELGGAKKSWKKVAKKTEGAAKKGGKKKAATSKKVESVVDDNNNRISAKKSVKNRSSTEEGAEAGRRRKSINWKIVEVGRSDFEDDIADVNGWSPSESSEEDYSTESDSSEDEGRYEG